MWYTVPKTKAITPAHAHLTLPSPLLRVRLGVQHVSRRVQLLVDPVHRVTTTSTTHSVSSPAPAPCTFATGPHAHLAHLPPPAPMVFLFVHVLDSPMLTVLRAPPAPWVKSLVLHAAATATPCAFPLPGDQALLPPSPPPRLLRRAPSLRAARAAVWPFLPSSWLSLCSSRSVVPAPPMSPWKCEALAAKEATRTAASRTLTSPWAGLGEEHPSARWRFLQHKPLRRTTSFKEKSWAIACLHHPRRLVAVSTLSLHLRPPPEERTSIHQHPVSLAPLPPQPQKRSTRRVQSRIVYQMSLTSLRLMTMLGMCTQKRMTLASTKPTPTGTWRQCRTAPTTATWTPCPRPRVQATRVIIVRQRHFPRRSRRLGMWTLSLSRAPRLPHTLHAMPATVGTWTLSPPPAPTMPATCWQLPTPMPRHWRRMDTWSRRPCPPPRVSTLSQPQTRWMWAMSSQHRCLPPVALDSRRGVE
eukprot:m.230204 g.230204  ORF g.230204 m.230204 type:complete len:470 (-) comp17953_c0_seq1:197-1606(-)